MCCQETPTFRQPHLSRRCKQAIAGSESTPTTFSPAFLLLDHPSVHENLLADLYWTSCTLLRYIQCKLKSHRKVIQVEGEATDAYPNKISPNPSSNRKWCFSQRYNMCVPLIRPMCYTLFSSNRDTVVIKIIHHRIIILLVNTQPFLQYFYASINIVITLKSVGKNKNDHTIRRLQLYITQTGYFIILPCKSFWKQIGCSKATDSVMSNKVLKN